jgi:hypothetical protein
MIWFFRSLHPIQDRKKESKHFFMVVPIFTELGQDLTHLAHQENSQSEIFLKDTLKILIVHILLSWGSNIISHLPWLKY